MSIVDKRRPRRDGRDGPAAAGRGWRSVGHARCRAGDGRSPCPRRRAFPSKRPRSKASISLIGGRIDDLSLRQYRETLDEDSPIVRLLSPVGGEEPYYALYGWAPGGDLGFRPGAWRKHGMVRRKRRDPHPPKHR